MEAGALELLSKLTAENPSLAVIGLLALYILRDLGKKVESLKVAMEYSVRELRDSIEKLGENLHERVTQVENRISKIEGLCEVERRMNERRKGG